jgi:type I restriction enzyme S subunit
MAVKKGYKQTEVGVIPEDWGVKQLKDIGEALIGLTYSPSNVSSDGILVLRSSNIQRGRLCFDDNVFVKSSVPDRIMVRSGDILICVRNGSRDLIGKSALINPSAYGMTFGAFMAVFRAENSRLLYHLFNSNSFVRQIREHLGATINQITNGSLNSFAVPLPPTLAEQEAIAGALSDVDAWIESLEQLIAKKRQIKQGAMQELLTGKRRLPGFSGDWLRRQLKELCIDGGLVRGPFGGTLKKEFFVDKGIAVYEQRNAIYRTSNDFRYFINQSKFAELRRFEIRHGDFIVSCSGTIGRIYRVPFGSPVGVINQALLLIRVNESIIVPSFFYHYFAWDCFQAFIIDNTQGGAMQNLVGMSVFKATEIATPSLAEQSAIAVVLSDMDTEIESLEQKLAKAREVKQGMMQELLTGRIRLV